jgi:lipid-A-disaccharide synthase
MDAKPVILFTAFEPSGDEHAAPVIAELRRLMPTAEIWALGGPKMRHAGAQLIEMTTGNAAMLGNALAKVKEQLALRRRFRGWLEKHPVAVHVPTDSPAANWAFCKMVKRRWGNQRVQSSKFKVQSSGGSTPHPAPRTLGLVVHLVAPQVWAWASWRVARLRKWSDLALCLLPFEPAWFAKRGVNARFIGHPLFDEPLDPRKLEHEAKGFPGGHPRIALLPGSRLGEVTANWPIMLEAFRRVSQRLPGATGLIAAAHERAAEKLRSITPELPANLRIVTGSTDAVLHWSDAVLTVSGTATLHVARHLKPMAILYKVGAASWHAVGRWLIDTRTFTLPNLVHAGEPHRDPSRHIIREFVPFLGSADDAGPIADEMAALLTDEAKRQRQIEAQRELLAKFAGHHAGKEAAEAIVELMAGK